MQKTSAIYRDLLLIGGGHSHALILKMWAMQPMAGVRLTLISPASLTPYSGMLPGLVAGHYNFEDTHIDLARLCQYAGARFIQAQVTGLDLQHKQVELLRDGSDQTHKLGFDLLSINSGITPDISAVGDTTLITPVKPISQFYPRWQSLLEKLEQPQNSSPQAIAVVGAGAAGVELILAMQHRLRHCSAPLEFMLINQGQELFPQHPRAWRKKITALLSARKIQLHNNFSVSRIDRDNPQSDSSTAVDTAAIRLSNHQGRALTCHHLFWCTGAKAASWPAETGLAVDRGFIAVNQHLQSLSHPFVFAAGDIALQQDHANPRAGVYAVRQAPTLFTNLRRYLLQQPLKRYRPQKTFLSLLACGDKTALGCRPGSVFPVLSGDWVWRWKNHIDQKFMTMFSQLPAMSPSADSDTPAATITNSSADGQPQQALDNMRCGGCGAKVGAKILGRVIRQLQSLEQDNILLGLHSGDDASATRVPAGKLWVQSVDVFRALLSGLDDPFRLGQIAAEHALSDLFAMHAQPHSAQAIITLPYGADAIVERDLQQLMNGAVEVLNRHGCSLTGGHTSEGAELSIGFSVNGLADETSLLHKQGPVLGHQLILTQALGTGCLFAAHGQHRAQGVWIEAALQAMGQSNRRAAEIFSAQGASACTDITGFGLAGHLTEMLKGSSVDARLRLDQLPALTGAIDCLQQGLSSSLQAQNQRIESIIDGPEPLRHHPAYPLLFDPQTSGGLLACVPRENTQACLAALKDAGYDCARVVGELIDNQLLQSAQAEQDCHDHLIDSGQQQCKLESRIKLTID